MAKDDQPGNNAEEPDLSWGDFCSGCKEGIAQKSGKDWAISFARFVALCASLYAFLFSLDLMGSSFKILGGCSAGSLFDSVSNPIAGLMVGILATVLVQSSSTSTSIVVSLVGSGAMSVTNAIPVIMGANIGTSVTNTLVSMGQIKNGDEYERAFAGATVHDMFNFLSVLVLLPIEIVTGMLFRLTGAMKPSTVGAGDKWEGPIKKVVAPLVKVLINVNKDVTKNVAKGKYTCSELYVQVQSAGNLNATLHEDDVVNGLLKGGAFYVRGASESDDTNTGIFTLILSLILLVACLFAMVSVLQSMVLGTSERMLRRATKVNPFLAMILGALITIMVQSSSITTSVLTPLVGVGVIPLEQMFPLTLGANVGTTATALLASLVSEKPEAVQIALCHLFFNLIGILIWFPVPVMRNVPLKAARTLGQMTRRSKVVPLFYILFAFVVAPLILLGVSSMYAGSLGLRVLGIMVTIFLVLAVAAFVFWMSKRGGYGKILSWLESRGKRERAFDNVEAELQELKVDRDEMRKENQVLLARLNALDGKGKSTSPQGSKIKISPKGSPATSTLAKVI